MFRRKRKRLGLALGSGAARGLAHIGVLKVLEAEGVQLHALSGTSIGAFIGALYAAGVPVGRMEEVARGVDWRQLARWINPILPGVGLIDSRKVALFMAELLPVRTFEELRLPLAVVATDIESGETLLIRQGNLLEALQAAVAFPGLFAPVRFGERYLVDGGLRNPVPVDVVRELGAEAVIGVCAIPEVGKHAAEAFLPAEADGGEPRRRVRNLLTAGGVEELLNRLRLADGDKEKPARPAPSHMGRKPPGIFRVCAQSVAIMENEINALRLERNRIDVLIRPDLNGITLLEFHRAAEAIRAGEEATRRQMKKVHALAGDD